ncbi:MAG: penicillin-binding protein 2, partial [Coriobacteriales bacterium]|jgi:penicillin-binding protein 2|nr:penicillin-binding protein 2 [Coriobacteriales bacterium]
MLFSGVEVESRMVRYYPYGALGAHVLGYTGPVTQDVLDAQTKDDNTQYEHGDSMGKDGAELSFEGILQGMHGERVYRVDVEGNTIGIISESEPVAGGDVCLTIDAKLQQQTDRIISEIITAARQGNDPDADSGALLVMDVPTGGILAMSSFPSFTPSDLSGGISEELWAQLMSKDSKYPLSNRAIAGVYPAASTFKPFISMVAQQNEFVKEDTYHECTGFWDPYGEQWGQRCWSYPYGHGTLGLEDAIKMSCDVYFYNIGAQFYEKWSAQPEDSRDNLLQKGLSDWGFSKRSGIDLPGESPGRLPDSEWKWQTFADTPEDAMWQPGDMSNMCIGQGDLLVTPLQLVNAYSAIARGYFIKPHIFHSVVDKDGNTIVEHKVQKSDEQPPFKPEYRARVIDGLKRVVQREGVFNDLPVEMAGKTGTGEQAGKGLLSWFVGYAPVDDPQYCVACVIEQGGSGSGTAMPAVHHTLAYIYDVELGPIVAGANTAER